MKPAQIVKAIVVVIIIAFTNSAYAQTLTISGRITDSATLEPLADVNLYIINSTINTKTNNNGEYKFDNLIPGNYGFIISTLGYGSKQVELTSVTTNTVLNIAVSFKPVQLPEVTINADNWENYLIMFKRDFIGNFASDECKILNPRVLNLKFSKKQNRLTASSNDFIDIENQFLGYKLRFLVNDFWSDYTLKKSHYSGQVIFEELKGNKLQQTRWLKNRNDVYNGSLRHFLTALAQKSLTKNGFEVRKIIREPNPERPPQQVIKARIQYFLGQQGTKNFKSDSLAKWSKLLALPPALARLSKTIKEKNLLLPAGKPNIYALSFKDSLYVIYKKRLVRVDYGKLERLKGAANYQIASITMESRNTPILFNKPGIVSNAENVFNDGAWNSRVARLLPFDYMPDNK